MLGSKPQHVTNSKSGRSSMNISTPYKKGACSMLETIIIVLLVLWLLGLIGGVGGNLVHVLLVVAVIIIAINLLGGRRGRL